MSPLRIFNLEKGNQCVQLFGLFRMKPNDRNAGRGFAHLVGMTVVDETIVDMPLRCVAVVMIEYA